MKHLDSVKKGSSLMKCLIIVYSYHHGNTDKIARIMAEILNAPIKKPNEVDIKELKEYELIGFGSGIYSEKHHEEIFKLRQFKSEVREVA